MRRNQERLMAGGASKVKLFVCIMLFMSLAVAGWGRNNWFSGRTVANQTRPISAGTGTIAAPADQNADQKTANATVSAGLIDLVISLWNSPKGDDDGNTQGNVGSEEQDKIETAIQYFSDAVYESTEGVHKLRKVRIYRNASRPDADIIWAHGGPGEGGPYASGGIGAAGTHICMFDIFEGGGAGGADYDYLSGLENAGYTLGHEWGHYFYGVYDEYKANVGAVVKVVPAIMNSQWNAAGRNYDWLNFSVAWRGGGTNGVAYGRFENTKKTRQHQQLGRSCWETLAISATNDPTGAAMTLGPRIYYPELTAVAPTGTSLPTTNLSNTAALNTLPSRTSLDIIWMGSNLISQIVIDRSGSMYGDPMANAKAAASMLVDNIALGDSVGVIDFDDIVTVLWPITTITNVAQKAPIKAAIATLSDRGMTAVGDAALAALAGLTAFPSTSNSTKIVFLLTDGESNTGSNPLDAIPAYQAAQIPIMSFAYGEYADYATLGMMASETGGRLYYSPTTFGAIAGALQDAYALAASRTKLLEGILGFGFALTDTSVSLPFTVEPGLKDLRVTYSYDNTYTVALALYDPNGVAQSVTSTNESSGEIMFTYDVAAPAPGTWILAGTGSSGAEVQYSADAVPTTFTYYFEAAAQNGETLAYPSPIQIVARLSDVDAINGAVVDAEITAPNGTETVLALANYSPGLYQGMFLPPANGVYSIVVQADNSAHTAYLTVGMDTSPTLDGENPLVADVPITADFTRAASFQVTYSGVPYSPSAPDAPANVVASDGDYSDRVLVTWDAAGQASLYEIWRHTDNDPANASKVDEVANTVRNWEDSSAGLGLYYYWIKARNIAGASAFSSSDTGWIGRLIYPVAGDFTGDHAGDVGVLDRYGNWYLWSITQSTIRQGPFTLGVTGKAVAADFDGDRMVDPTVMDGQGQWYVWFSSAGYMRQGPFALGTFGSPVAADFDGDRKADPAVVDGQGQWYVWFSSAGYPRLGPFALNVIGSPAAGDYDGDRMADPAVLDARGQWHVWFSSAGYMRLGPFPLGIAGMPVVTDYDGDSLADPALLDVDGNWYVWASAYGYQRFGPFVLTLP